MHSSTRNLPGSLDFACFHKVASVLECFVSSSPGPLDVNGIMNELDVGEAEATGICKRLQKAGLISKTDDRGKWILAKDRSNVTLEDVWHSLSLNRQSDVTDAGCRSPEVELLVAQAFMEMHQNISCLLRQFQLDRVTVSKGSSLHIVNNFLLKSRSRYTEE